MLFWTNPKKEEVHRSEERAAPSISGSCPSIIYLSFPREYTPRRWRKFLGVSGVTLTSLSSEILNASSKQCGWASFYGLGRLQLRESSRQGLFLVLLLFSLVFFCYSSLPPSSVDSRAALFPAIFIWGLLCVVLYSLDLHATRSPL